MANLNTKHVILKSTQFKDNKRKSQQSIIELFTDFFFFFAGWHAVLAPVYKVEGYN
jgi:hypothetical protein